MKRWMFWIACAWMCVFVLGCGNKLPTEKEIILDISERVTEFSVENPFTGVVENSELEITNFEIEKSQTTDSRYSAYCVISMENQFYQFRKYIVCDYIKYDGNKWELDGFREYQNAEFTVVENPFTEEDVYKKEESLGGWYFGSGVEAKEINFTLDENTVWCQYTYEQYYKYKTTSTCKTLEYSFNGSCWEQISFTSNTSNNWNIEGYWKMVNDSEHVDFSLRIDSFDSNNLAGSGSCKFSYAYSLYSETKVDSYCIEDAEIEESYDGILFIMFDGGFMVTNKIVINGDTAWAYYDGYWGEEIELYLPEETTTIDNNQLSEEEKFDSNVDGNAERDYVYDRYPEDIYENIVVFGVDDTNGRLVNGTCSNSILIISIDKKTNEIRTVNIPENAFLAYSIDDEGNKLGKCNVAYSYGGAEQAIKMLNVNMDLDINNFITIGYEGIIQLVDGIGGVWVYIDESEMEAMNETNCPKYITSEMAEKLLPIEATGYQLLDGVQAATYCLGNLQGIKDGYTKAARQQEICTAILEGLIQMNTDERNVLLESMSDNIYTSCSREEVYNWGDMIAEGKIGDTVLFPFANMCEQKWLGSKGTCTYPIQLEQNVQELHNYLFGEDNYEVSSPVKKISDEIESFVSQYID